MRVRQNPSHVARQSTTLAISKILLVAITQLPITRALPMHLSTYIVEEGAKSTEDPSLWIYLGVAAALVLLGGAFAGLTIALMGQVETFKYSDPCNSSADNLCRMKSTFKSFKPRAKNTRKEMLQKCSSY